MKSYDQLPRYLQLLDGARPTSGSVIRAIHEASRELYREIESLIRDSELPATMVGDVLGELASRYGAHYETDYVALPKALVTGEYQTGREVNFTFPPNTDPVDGECRCEPQTFDFPGEQCDSCADNSDDYLEYSEVKNMLGHHGVQQYLERYDAALDLWATAQPQSDYDPFAPEGQA